MTNNPMGGMNWIGVSETQEASYFEDKSTERNSVIEKRTAPVVTSRPCSCPPSPRHHISAGLVVDPRPADVFLGRGKGSYERRGNKAYMEIISSYLPAYVDSKGNKGKTRITEEIVVLVKKNGGRFLGVDPSNGFLYQVSDADARMKVSQALRHQRLVREKKRRRKASVHLAVEEKHRDGGCEKRKGNEGNHATCQGIQGSKCADAATALAEEGSARIARNDHDFLFAQGALSPEERVEEDLYWCHSSERETKESTNALTFDAPIDIICDDDLFSVLLIDIDNDLEFNIKSPS